MALTQTPTSELEAINRMLATIQQAPVSSLANISGLADASIAQTTLHEVNREVQTEGWHWNTEYDYPLIPAVDKTITLPTDCLDVDSYGDSADYDVAMRNGKLYDRYNRTYEFTETIKVELIKFLPFEQLPEPARLFIMIRACRLFANKMMASETIEQFTAEDEARARARMKSKEAQNADYNILSGNTWALDIWNR